MALVDGYTDVPAGKVAFIATSLEMKAAPPPRQVRADPRLAIRRVTSPDLAWYRDLFKRVGSDWLWYSRLKLDDEALKAIIQHRDVAIFALAADGRDEGLLELDFRARPDCELAFFGVTARLIGQGAGRMLMEQAITAAWQAPIDRLWVHTCTGDHPAALDFYIRSGFVPYKRQLEMADDPRLKGLLPETSGAHIPIIRDVGR